MSLSYCKLSGELPGFFDGRFSRLRSLLLGSNRFTGAIPQSWSQLEALEELLLFENQLTGGLPDALFSGCRRLTKVFVGSNQFEGKLPDSVGELEALRELVLSNTGLSGALPMQLRHSRGLKAVDVSGTHITVDNMLMRHLRGRQVDLMF